MPHFPYDRTDGQGGLPHRPPSPSYHLPKAKTMRALGTEAGAVGRGDGGSETPNQDLLMAREVQPAPPKEPARNGKTTPRQAMPGAPAP